MISSEKLKAAVTMPDLLRAYGFDINRANKIVCPFHSEKTPSCHVYETSFHCFGCGAGGDIFTFVRRYFGLTFPQAVMRISHDFGISVDMTERRPSAEVERIKREKEEKALAKHRRDTEYMLLAAEHRQLCRDLSDYAPVSPYDFVHERYVKALHRIEYVRYRLSELL